MHIEHIERSEDMKVHNIQDQYKKSYVIEQLAKHGYTDVYGKSYKELRHRLAVIRAMDVEVKNPESDWF